MSSHATAVIILLNTVLCFLGLINSAAYILSPVRQRKLFTYFLVCNDGHWSRDKWQLAGNTESNSTSIDTAVNALMQWRISSVQSEGAVGPPVCSNHGERSPEEH